jgi:hypothetical protein
LDDRDSSRGADELAQKNKKLQKITGGTAEFEQQEPNSERWRRREEAGSAPHDLTPVFSAFAQSDFARDARQGALRENSLHELLIAATSNRTGGLNVEGWQYFPTKCVRCHSETLALPGLHPADES